MSRHHTLLILALLAAPAVARQQVPPQEYRGRRIAPTMHSDAAPWLTRSTREQEERTSGLLRFLDIQPGDVVCDFGCGNGYHSLMMAEQVGESGRVAAVDIQPRMLELLLERAARAGLASRVDPILATETDSGLGEGRFDLVLMVDVYHELSDPEATLRAVKDSLGPAGRLVLVEFREEDPEVPIKPLHKMSKRQILRELIPNGFRLVAETDELPWQHVMAFGRGDPGPLQRDASAALARATELIRGTAIRGGYVGISSVDLQQRFGESLDEKAGEDEIWIQPPGTPTVLELFLRAFRLTGDDRYLQAARDAGRALAWGQKKAGGWDHRADLSGLTADALRPRLADGRCTFDDDISQGALRALIALDDLLEERWLTDAIQRGIEHLLEAQNDAGSWPQWFPLRGGYHDLATFNDGAINDCIRTALLAADRYGRTDCEAAALKGGEYIIASRLNPPRAGWAQQYDAAGRPAPARSFEPAALCPAVTARNLRTLLMLHHRTGESRFLAPIRSAISWLESSRREDGRWARFLDPDTGKALYADRDGSIHESVETLSEERRSGYSWHGTWGIPRLIRHWRALGPLEPEALSRKLRTVRPWWQDERSSPSDDEVRRVIDALDQQGRWLRNDRIHIHDFVRNAGVLLDALDSTARR